MTEDIKDQELQDSGLSHKYFYITPNVIDDMGLSPIAFRLYSHFKRVAGDNGYCSQSQRKLAEICCCSGGTIVTAKQELAERGLINIERMERPDQPGRPYHKITLVDIWSENMATYQKDKGQVVTIENEGKGQPEDLIWSPPDLHGQPEDCIKNLLTKNINKEPSDFFEKNASVGRRFDDVKSAEIFRALTGSTPDFVSLMRVTELINDVADQRPDLDTSSKMSEFLKPYLLNWVSRFTKAGARYRPGNPAWIEEAAQSIKIDVMVKPPGTQNADGSFYL